jgi:TetR/AcrR family transcriptional regulator, transcriptional repressor for nem operon
LQKSPYCSTYQLVGMKTLEKPNTKEALLDAAQNLMLEKGFVATSVDEICAAAHVTKGSFFHYFKSKDELGKILIQRFSMEMGSAIMDHVNSCGDDPRDRVYGFIEAAMECGSCCDSKGCLVGTFTQELSESHPVLRSCCEASFTEMCKLFESELKKAKQLYAKNKDMDTRGLAEQFMATIQGSMLLIKAMRDRSLMKRTLTHFRSYLEQLLGK